MSAFIEISEIDKVLARVKLESATPVTKDNFVSVIDEYKIHKGHLECLCAEGFKNVCKQKHKHGYIVKLKDNSLSLIGNRCAKLKFAEDSEIRKSIVLYKNQQKLKERLGKLYTYKQEAEKHIEHLEKLKEKLKVLKSNTLNLYINIGDTVYNNLWRAPDNIKIIGTSSKHDKETNTKETIKIEHTLGGLRGINILDDGIFDKPNRLIDRCIYGLKQLEKLSAYDETSSKNIKIFENNLEGFDDVETLVLEIESYWQEFISNDLVVFIFAARKDRHKIVRYLNPEMSNSQAKSLIKSIEKKLAEDLKVDRVQNT